PRAALVGMHWSVTIRIATAIGAPWSRLARRSTAKAAAVVVAACRMVWASTPTTVSTTTSAAATMAAVSIPGTVNVATSTVTLSMTSGSPVRTVDGSVDVHIGRSHEGVCERQTV